MALNKEHIMKRFLILSLAICMFALSGCGNAGVSTNEYGITNHESGITGLYEHSEYPDAYKIVISEETNNIIDFEVSAIRGNAAQIATARMTGVELVDGVGSFSFVDSFNNSGTGEIVLDGTQLSISFNTNQPYQGNWCVDAAEGSYTKTKEMSELDGMSGDVVVEDGQETIGLEQFGVTDKWMYRVVEYTNSGEDIYDDDIDFNISESEGSIQSRENGRTNEKVYFITENGYDSIDRERDGFIKAYPSDRNGYDAKLHMERHDGSEEILYLRVLVPDCVFEFTYENGEEFGIYETMDYAHRDYNTDSTEYRRDDYEYKEYYNKPTGWVPDEYK